MPGPRITTRLVFLITLGTIAAPVRARPADGPAPVYEAAVRAYAAGQHVAAVDQLIGIPDKELPEQVRRVAALWREGRGCPACPAETALRRVPLRAALMLHGDCAQRRRQDGSSPRAHEDAAFALARVLAEDPEHRAFSSRFFVAMVGIAQGENRWTEALEWADRGLRATPGSADLLLARGAVEESIACRLPARTGGEPGPDRASSERRAGVHRDRTFREGLERAQQALRSSVESDPSLLEARLRLGRVAWLLGDPAEARSALAKALEGGPQPDHAFLAHLFLGRVLEDEGEHDAAARSYEAALALLPDAQSARVASSHLRLRQGDTAAARRDIETALRPAGRRKAADPFWLYPWGSSVGIEKRLENLRTEASS